MSETLYDILELDPYASGEEIKRAFWHKAKILHPDISGLPQEGFQRVKHAYEILKDSRSRGIYDRDIGIQSSLSRSVLESCIETQGFHETTDSSSDSEFYFLGSLKSIRARKIFNKVINALNPRAIGSKFIFQSKKTEDVISEQHSEDIPSKQNTPAFAPIKVCLKVCNEETLPVSAGEKFSIGETVLNASTNLMMSSLLEILVSGFKETPDIQRATLHELSFPESDRSSVLLVLLERPVDVYWGILNIPSINFPKAHPLLSEVVLMWVENSPFFENITQKSLEIYKAQSLN